MYIGYFYTLDNISDEEDCLSIEYLNRNEIYESLLLERDVFHSMNITKNQLINWINDDEHIILVYKENKKMLGFIIIEVYGTNNQSCFIRNVGVNTGERGRGIGKALLLYGLREAKKKGVSKAMLWVGYDNVAARSLYEKVGFKLDENEAEVVFQV